MLKKILSASETTHRDNVFRQSLSEFNRSLTLIVDLDQLILNVISVIRETVRIESLFVFLLDLNTNRFKLVEYRGFNPENEELLSFSPDGNLIQWFTVNETELKISDNPQIFSFFQPDEQQIIRETGIDLIFPLLSMNRLTGLVCLGPKNNVDELNADEIELLTALLGQAALAFENAYLYRQQGTRLKRMYRADRLATLGQLAAGAAHEIRNPLTSIRSTIQYLQKKLDNAEQKELIGELIGEVDRINGIVEGMLSFSRPTKPEIVSVDIHFLLKQVIMLVDTTAQKKGFEISLDYKTPVSETTADPALLKQVFLNIIMNAFEAMERGGKVKIAVDLIVRNNVSVADKNSMFLIFFSDNGPGIASNEIEHVFDPFYTTKKEGTGLGLSISYGIIHQHDGDIEIESITRQQNPSRHGTTVTIKLPVNDPAK